MKTRPTPARPAPAATLPLGSLCTLLLAVLLSACEGNGPFGLDTPNLQGRWVYSARNLSGAGMTCNVHGAALELDQEGSRFWGSVTEFEIKCTVTDADTFFLPAGRLAVAGGRVNGGKVRFEVGSSDFPHEGTLEGGSMSGTATWRIDRPVAGPVTLRGTFAAAREE